MTLADTMGDKMADSRSILKAADLMQSPYSALVQGVLAELKPIESTPRETYSSHDPNEYMQYTTEQYPSKWSVYSDT